MDENIQNSGFIFSGTTNVSGSAIGSGNTVSSGPVAARPQSAALPAWDIGIVTVLSVEARAVIAALGLAEERAGGHTCYSGRVTVPGATMRVVATRTLGQGQRSVMNALDNLHRNYRPRVFVLVGIGGAIHRAVDVDDVVVATRVVYYDLRKLAADNIVHRRGQERESPAATGHAVNSFFTDNGEPAVFNTEGKTPFRVFSGPIGSGEAVVADAESEIRRFLMSYNDKTLAIDMEAGGLSQYCHERSADSGVVPSWVVIRGISDRANPDKGDDHHDSAARHAAHVLRALLPYFRDER